MKKTKYIIAIISISIFMAIPMTSFGDPPGMPGDHGANGDVPGGGAPIGGGVMVLASMGLAYGYAKFKLGSNGISGFDEISRQT